VRRWSVGASSLSPAPQAQAVFCRRRHQPRRPPLAKIRPGSPAAAIASWVTPRGIPNPSLQPRPRVRGFFLIVIRLIRKIALVPLMELGEGSHTGGLRMRESPAAFLRHYRRRGPGRNSDRRSAGRPPIDYAPIRTHCAKLRHNPASPKDPLHIGNKGAERSRSTDIGWSGPRRRRASHNRKLVARCCRLGHFCALSCLSS
jgi:hypothetical protein